MKTKKILSVIGNIIFYAIIAILLITGISARMNNDIPTVFGYSFMHVISPSMEPSIMTNDLVIGKAVDIDDEIIVGDVYIYERADGLKIIHRVIEEQNGGFIFKGDNNANQDIDLVLKEEIVFKYLFKIPQFGIIISLLQDFRIYVGLGVLYLIYFLYQIYKTKKEINTNK